VAKAKKPPRGRRSIDWKKGRRLRERDGKSFSEISRVLGCHRETVSAHAKREGWIDPTEIQQETGSQRREKIFREFIERDAEAIHRNLAKKHELASILLDQALLHAKRLQGGIEIELEKQGKDGGTITLLEDPIASLRKLGLLGQNVEVIDRNLADLSDDGWRSKSAGGGADTETREDRVQAALDELAGAGSAGRRGRSQG
jgi:hypothetical protein